MTTAAATTATSAVQTNGSSQGHDKRYCEACKRDITVKGYETHYKTQRHSQRARVTRYLDSGWLQILTKHKMTKMSKFWCDICKTNVRLTHIE